VESRDGRDSNFDYEGDNLDNQFRDGREDYLHSYLSQELSGEVEEDDEFDPQRKDNDEQELADERQSALSDFAQIEALLNSRWPETKIEPSLTRISRLMEFLGDPQLAYPVIHVTGTNGKTSTARMIESLLRELGLNTGLTTSPHLHSITERIRLNGESVDAQRFVAAYDEIEPFIAMVDSESLNEGGPAMSYFEVLTGLAFSIFADAPVDVAIIEVGMGGSWDATNVVQPAVSVVTPIGIDHAEYLGDTIELIAQEKAGIIKSGAIAVLANQTLEAAEVLLKRAIDVGAIVARQGEEFQVNDRQLALGGQVINLEGINGTYPEIVLSLFGPHMAMNASVALAAVESFFGGNHQLNLDSIQRGFANVKSPGRLEVVRRSPTVIVDAAHNPHGAEILALALQESFTFDFVVGVVSVMGDKDVAGVLRALEPVFNEVVLTANGTPRAMPAGELFELAGQIFGEDRIHLVPRMSHAIDQAIEIADDSGSTGVGVVVTGSVVTAAQGRALLGHMEA
jgi:dihydrofolate synthase/folylpolyglutamate synthase